MIWSNNLAAKISSWRASIKGVFFYAHSKTSATIASTESPDLQRLTKLSTLNALPKVTTLNPKIKLN